MKKKLIYIVLVFLFLNTSFQVFGQFNKYEELYINTNSSTYQLNKTISAASLGGDLELANKQISILKDEGLYKNYLLTNALLKYNLYGKQNAYTIIDQSTKVTEEWKAYSKILLAFLTKNHEDQDALYNAFNNQFPNSKLRLFLDLRFHINYIYENIHNEDEEQSKYLFDEINKRLITEKEEEHILYFKLAKLDLNKTSNKDELVNLWNAYSHLMNADNVLKMLSDCNTLECGETIINAIGKLKKKPRNKLALAFRELEERSQNYPTLKSEFENLIINLINKTNNNGEREILKAMIYVKSDILPDNMKPQSSIMFIKYNYIAFSDSINSILTPSITKEEYINLVKQEFRKKDLKKVERGFDDAKINELQYITGRYCNELQNLKNIKTLFKYTGFSKPEDKHFYSWNAMGRYLDKNPLYYINNGTYADFPPTESKNDLKKALNVYNNLIKKYPHCVSLLKTKNLLLTIYWSYLQHLSADEYYEQLFQSAFAIFANRQSDGSDLVKDSCIEYIDFGNNKDLKLDDNQDILATLISPKLKNRLTKQLKELQKKHPLNSNFKTIEAYFK